jgi:hypothetical protein
LPQSRKPVRRFFREEDTLSGKHMSLFDRHRLGQMLRIPAPEALPRGRSGESESPSQNPRPITTNYGRSAGESDQAKRGKSYKEPRGERTGGWGSRFGDATRPGGRPTVRERILGQAISPPRGATAHSSAEEAQQCPDEDEQHQVQHRDRP